MSKARETSTAEDVASRVVPGFRFLTNHAKTLLLIAEDPHIRIRDIATLSQITERATQRIVNDLVEAEYIARRREGRRSVYSVRAHSPLGLPIQRDINVGTLLAILVAQDDPRSATAK
jgi:predicted transcriptional regulator